MGALMQFMLNIGILFVYALGIEDAVDWSIITVLCTIPAGMSATIMFFMPESPYYLVAKGKDDAALKSLQWLTGSENAKDVLEDIKREYREQKLIGSVSYVKLLTDAVYLRPFLIVMALMFFQQFSGINAVFFYMKVSSKY